MKTWYKIHILVLKSEDIEKRLKLQAWSRFQIALDLNQDSIYINVEMMKRAP